jgi:hypothetical protein
VEWPRVNANNLAHKSKVRGGHALGSHATAVRAGHSERGGSTELKDGDELLVDLAGKRHRRDFKGLLVGHTKSVYELSDFPDPVQPGRDNGPTTVDQDGLIPGIKCFTQIADHGLTMG